METEGKIAVEYPWISVFYLFFLKAEEQQWKDDHISLAAP